MNAVTDLCRLCIVLYLIHVSYAEVLGVDDDDNMDSIEKRAPGWGKRSDQNSLEYINILRDLSRLERNKDNSDMGLVKRRPGWGKRSYDDEFELSKRKPGWGKRSYFSLYSKRAPGWGKRDSDSEQDILEEERSKRRPGWGKRSMYDDGEIAKRRPGWGKRAPGWGKRSESSQQMCRPDLLETISLLRLKLAQVNNISFYLIHVMTPAL